MQTKGVATPGGTGARDGGELPAGRLLFRFGVGLAALAGEWLVSGLRDLQGRPGFAAGDPDAPPETPLLAPRHAVLGAIVAAPRAVARTAARVVPATRRMRGLADRGGRMLRRLPVSRAVARSLGPWRLRAAIALGRVAVTGREEETEARALAERAVRTLFRTTTAAIADSPDVKRVIEEQSQGLAVAAITGLRARSARADNAVESAARRLLGRRKVGRSE